MIERGPFVLYFIILFVFLWLPCFIPSFTQGGLPRARFQNPARGFRPKILDKKTLFESQAEPKKKKKEDGISTWVEGITGHGVRKGTRSDIGYPNDFDGVYHGGRIESEKLAAV